MQPSTTASERAYIERLGLDRDLQDDPRSLVHTKPKPRGKTMRVSYRESLFDKRTRLMCEEVPLHD